MIETVKNKRVVVLGLGHTGLSALRWLVAQGAKVIVADTRENPPNLQVVRNEMPSVEVFLGDYDTSLLLSAELMVISPGVALSTPAVRQAIDAGVPVVGDIELFARFRSPNAKVIAITGSNGKTTVTTLVGEMCKTAGLKTIVAGNIGLPVLEALDADVPDVYVLELSSFQLETTNNLIADVATVLNVTEDHMDRYPDLSTYAAAKAHIFYKAKHQVLNRDDAWSMVMERPQLALTTYGLDAAADGFGIEDNNNEIWLCDSGKHLINAADLHIRGAHNVSNALAALALCRAIGLEYAPLLSTLYNFKGLPHRVEWVAEIDKVDYFDDSKGTNVGATCAAISGLPQKVVLIAGGDGKDQNFSPLVRPVKENARAVVLIGRDAPIIEKVLLETMVPIYHANDMQEAVAIARRVAQAGDAVLLSPACASLDMYENYIRRAEAFVAAVKRLEVEVAC
ncbi:MAG: UDP-N-acetylmuramoyl-L-alanine--D-glutamate ligase [Methylotenera sp.]